MKILKRPENMVFDTDNPDKMEFNPTVKAPLTPLHHLTTQTDWDFLLEHFKPVAGKRHPIFNNFGNSYFYGMSV